MQLEDPPCPLCRAESHRVAYRFDPFQVVRCLACGFYYLRPRLTEAEMMKVYSRGDYYEPDQAQERVGYSSYKQQEKSLCMTYREFLKGVVGRGGDFLEIGCGKGYLVREALKLGCFSSLTATDYAPDAVVEARQTGVEVILGGLSEVPADREFDLIVMTQVLEHVYDPVGFLAEIRGRLRPGGRVAVTVPNMRSPLRWLLGRRWPSFKVPEHVGYFDLSSLRRAFLSAGYQRAEWVPSPHAFPLSLLAEKFGLRLPERLGRVVIWLPTTCLAAVGSR